MKLPLDPHFPVADEDAGLLDQLADTPVKPIFIMGLHRSGTTFLYDCVARSFPLAQQTLYHHFYYQRLLKNHQSGDRQRDCQRLDNLFAAMNIKDRGIDSVPVGANMVEEYGFLLRQHTGSFKLNAGNAAFFKQFCQKVLAIESGAQALILKNPWDTGNAAEILKHFPDAKFIYITREPIAVLNSMLNATLTYLKGPQHYLEMLLGGYNGRGSYRAGYIAWWLLRGTHAVLGDKLMSRLARSPLAKTVAAQILVYREEIASLPSHSAVEIDYASLVNDPNAVMRSLAPLIDLPMLNDCEPLEVKSRRPLNPALENYQPQLQRLLRELQNS